MARKRKRSKAPIIILILVVVVVSGIMFTRGQKDTRTKVLVDVSTKRTIVETVYASGNIYPVVEVEITSNVSGTIVELKVEEGQSVKEGDLLAKIDPDALSSIVERAEASANTTRAQLKQTKAQKVQLEAQFKNTKAIYDRNKQLFEDGVISKADFEASQAAFETAKANLQGAEESIRAAEFMVKSSEATVKEQRKNLSQTRIYAPMSGVVSILYKKKGEQVVGTAQMAGTPILKIANLNSVEAQVQVNERDILKVQLGDTADIELDAYPGRKFEGIVTQISNTANSLTSMISTSDQVIDFKVHVLMSPDSYSDLQNGGSTSPFRAGLSASVEIKTETLKGALTVPVACVTAREEDEDEKEQKNKKENKALNEYVFVKQADSVLLKEVKTGIQDDDYIHILSGLSVGDTIVTAPYDAIANVLEQGAVVKVVDEDELYNRKKDKKQDK
ncbi:MAG: efflux RND transporter periplasmic adaptor subunit [Saprospiraceae bacterium]|nr:efflux RND transporter periplasmic adaptor subunit [Saprospiraceae bacterium]